MKKVYVLMVSKVFPATHPRAGELTHFMSKILLNFDQVVVQYPDESQSASRPGYASKYAAAIVREGGFEPKLHTLRENYDLWTRRAEKINRGEAVLSLRQWSGKPYRSKQQEFLQLEKIGLQYISIISGRDFCYIDGQTNYLQIVSKQDGLSEDDFRAWFKKDFVGVILHFTDFKY